MMEYFYGYEPIPAEDIMDYFTDAQKYAMLPWEDRVGMKVTSGVVTLEKDQQNLVGVSIGGGLPNCPCLYIVQIFDNTPASRDGTLAAGDEIVGINGVTVKGRTKSEVARMIQASKATVSVNYNKLHADPKHGKTLDLVLKKVKHRVVEGMTSSTADALGLSRAILCNDSMVKKLQELENTELMYRSLVQSTKKYLKAFFDLSRAHRAFGDVFSNIGVREPLPRASLVFSNFGETHRELEKNELNLINTIKPMMTDLNTYLKKAIPDTKLTIKKYLNSKFEYLSYCLKVKEMDDEECGCYAINEYLYRVETGNYEYRLVLRCRQEARSKFAQMRKDVLVKLELLDNKRVQDMVFQLQRFVAALAQCHTVNHGVMKVNQLFPIEVDLSMQIFEYNTTGQMPNEEEDENDASTFDPDHLPRIHDDDDDDDDDGDTKVMKDNILRDHDIPQTVDAGEQKLATNLERDLFDLFLDSPISIPNNSSLSSLNARPPLDNNTTIRSLMGDSNETTRGDDAWVNNGSLDKSESNQNKTKMSSAGCKQGSINLVSNGVEGNSRNMEGGEDFIDLFDCTLLSSNNNSNQSFYDCNNEEAINISNSHEGGGDDDDDDECYNKINRPLEKYSNVVVADDDDDDGLSDEFFFEALRSVSPCEGFIKDFMSGTRAGHDNDCGDGDLKMLEIPTTNEYNDCILLDVDDKFVANVSLDVGNKISNIDDVLIDDVNTDQYPVNKTRDDENSPLVCVDSF